MSSGHLDFTAGAPDRHARAVQRAECGEHLCSFDGRADERRRVATAFVAGALAAGDRVMYVSSGQDACLADGLLPEAGTDVGEAIRSGQLTVLDLAAVGGSPPDSAQVTARYREEADRSRAAGFPGLRIAVDMAGIVAALGSVEDVARWEKIVDQTFADADITALCQYDGRLVDEAARGRIAGEHAAVAVDDGSAPLATFMAGETPDVLRVAGELDVTTAARFARALRARAAVSRRVRVDLAAVTFADLTGVRTIFEVARELPPDATLVLCRTPSPMQRLLRLIGWREPRVEVRPD